MMNDEETCRVVSYGCMSGRDDDFGGSQLTTVTQLYGPGELELGSSD